MDAEGYDGTTAPDGGQDGGRFPDGWTVSGGGTDCVDTVELRLSDDLEAALAAGYPAAAAGFPQDVGFSQDAGFAQEAGFLQDASFLQEARLPPDDLLDGVPGWGPVPTPAGTFQLVPVRMTRDLPLITLWMNDPAVAAFWELDGPDTVTAAHLRPQLDGDGRSIPCLGTLGGVPMSYWEIYRADLDALARSYPARPHDTGLHFLIGRVADRGRGLGTLLLRTVADLVLDRRPLCGRVVGEPDLRNTPSTAAFLGAGFRLTAEIELPGKRAALMIRDRALRTVL
ncbi:GNAT family N-acetyltransferase [Streptomyces luteosporeus]|uniref:Lysine N-acyltransferase MbtK n=1 Tax=Streptomyces luteosporeus TaxID=173856 RepID=A0ABN3TN18_9ACTN